MPIGEPSMCYCNRAWCSILPPPPCPYHTQQAVNINVFIKDDRKIEEIVKDLTFETRNKQSCQ